MADAIFVPHSRRKEHRIPKAVCKRRGTQKTEKELQPEGNIIFGQFIPLSFRLCTTKGTPPPKLRGSEVFKSYASQCTSNKCTSNKWRIKNSEFSCSALFPTLHFRLHTSHCIYCRNCLKSKYSIVIVFMRQYTACPTYRRAYPPGQALLFSPQLAQLSL